MADGIRALGNPAAQETANFVQLCNDFFDCCNVRSELEGKKKRNPNLLPYTSVDDPRFEVSNLALFILLRPVMPTKGDI